MKQTENLTVLALIFITFTTFSLHFLIRDKRWRRKINSSRLMLTILFLFATLLVVFFFSGILNLFQITLLFAAISIAIIVNSLDSLLPERELLCILLDHYLVEWGGATPFKMIGVVTSGGSFKTTFFSGNFPILVNEVNSVKRKTKINITYTPILKRILFVKPSGPSKVGHQVMRDHSEMMSK